MGRRSLLFLLLLLSEEVVALSVGSNSLRRRLLGFSFLSLRRRRPPSSPWPRERDVHRLRAFSRSARISGFDFASTLLFPAPRGDSSALLFLHRASFFLFFAGLKSAEIFISPPLFFINADRRDEIESLSPM